MSPKLNTEAKNGRLLSLRMKTLGEGMAQVEDTLYIDDAQIQGNHQPTHMWTSTLGKLGRGQC